MNENIKDQMIWDNFREGSKSALEIIYTDNYSPLFYYGRKFTKEDDLIKDTIQELFIELIQSGKKLSGTYNIRFYLLRALRNKLLHQLSVISKMKTGQVHKAGFSILEPIEAQLIEKEIEEGRRKQILSAIKKLSVKQQEIIYLRFYRDLSYPEIADLFEVNIQTVRNLLSRAIKSLREDLENDKLGQQMVLFVFNLPIE